MFLVIYNILTIIITDINLMKNRQKTQNLSGNKNLNIESKAKIYVPISISNNSQTQQTLISDSNSTTPDSLLVELKRANSQLRQKEQIYIDKLIKLQEGLEKQHEQFMHLQDLYNQLFNSYKQKEQEIAELEQKYRQTNRKKQNSTHQLPSHSQLQQNQNVFKKQILQQKQTIQKLQARISQYDHKINDLEKTIQKLCSEVSYYKNKDKMNDSRASLNSKVFQELGEWQKQADLQKQQKIKLQYENKFLKSRNQDLQNRITQLQDIITSKQSQVLRLRQNNIVLSRQNSENRLLRSNSRSPRKYDQKQNSDKKTDYPTKTSRIIDELHIQNTILKKQLQNLKQSFHNSYNLAVKSPTKNDHYIRHQQFFSFSRDDYSNHSSNQQNYKGGNIKQNIIKIENDYQIQKVLPRQSDLSNQKRETDEIGNESLQQLPAQLEIDNIIMNSKRKENMKI